MMIGPHSAGRFETRATASSRPQDGVDRTAGTKLANLQRDANHYSWRGLMSEFAIGQKIVCVRDDWKNSVFGSSVRETGERHPVKDGVYTVIGHDWLLLADRPGVIIAEVNNDCIWA